MTSHLDHPTESNISGNAASEVFEREWRTYRKMVDNNYLFHREAYAQLREVVTMEFRPPFRFLDIACGDASATTAALSETEIAQYHGIDLSAEALEIAQHNLRGLGCPVTLERGDFQERLAALGNPVDVAWVGLSLHHLHAPAKLKVMRRIRTILGNDGIFVAYENASPDGETRVEWLRRWDAQQSDWTEFSALEWQTISDHVHANDVPETNACWHILGREAGFREVNEVFVSPNDLFRMYLFRR